ncbi:DUF6157 family protein [Paenibacillus apis]|uniref:Uncharacterized protein n=1 Tax=Paenibacillus apis TaxID=1792174 RepID=A0A919Y3Y2_9BACL|nr:DUF6157 family protein [Paenibacillus apis]GIO41692.1 hypothetical protein J41TS4_14500 [Paenibacillus apis]
MKDINYYSTFIAVADDCPVSAAEVPQAKGGVKTVPVIQYEMISRSPYVYTQADVLFEVHADLERESFFSRSQACLRASALGKRYGWGIHHNAEGKMALYAVESEEYRKLLQDRSIKQVKAMRSSRKS